MWLSVSLPLNYLLPSVAVIFLLVYAPYVGHYVVTVCGLNSPLLMTSVLGPQRVTASGEVDILCKSSRVSAATERNISSLYGTIHKLYSPTRQWQLWTVSSSVLT